MNAKSQLLLRGLLGFLLIVTIALYVVVLNDPYYFNPLLSISSGIVIFAIAIGFMVKAHLFSLYSTRGEKWVNISSTLTLLASAVWLVPMMILSEASIFVVALMFVGVIIAVAFSKFLNYLYGDEYLVLKTAELRSRASSLMEYQDYDDEVRGYLSDIFKVLSHDDVDGKIVNQVKSDLDGIDEAVEKLKEHKNSLRTVLHGRSL